MPFSSRDLRTIELNSALFLKSALLTRATAGCFASSAVLITVTGIVSESLDSAISSSFPSSLVSSAGVSSFTSSAGVSSTTGASSTESAVGSVSDSGTSVVNLSTTAASSFLKAIASSGVRLSMVFAISISPLVLSSSVASTASATPSESFASTLFSAFR